MLLDTPKEAANPSTEMCTFSHSDIRLGLCCGVLHMLLPLSEITIVRSQLQVNCSVSILCSYLKIICIVNSTKFCNYL